MIRLKVYTGIAFAFMVVLMLVVFSITYLNLQLIEDYTRHHSEESMPNELLADTIEINILKTQEILTDTALTAEPNGFELAEEKARIVFHGLEKSRQLARKNDEMAVLDELDSLERNFREFFSIGRDMTKFYLQGDLDNGNREMADFDKRGEELLKKYEGIRDLQVYQQKADTKRILSTIHQAKILLLSTCLIALCVSILTAFAILSLK